LSERDKLALNYTVAVVRTPVEVTDELFARMKERFSEEQLVEITPRVTVVNLDRLNAPFGIGSAGLSRCGVRASRPPDCSAGPAVTNCVAFRISP
jgi:hypothetical protein